MVNLQAGFKRLLPVQVLLLALLVNDAYLKAQVQPTSVGRQLAPDALVVIPPGMEFGETFQGPIDLPLVETNPELKWTPNEGPESDTLFQRAQGIIFRVPVHCLEFAFKPVRTIEVSLPSDQGLEKQLVWYMVYRVRYLGNDHQPAVEQDEYGNQVYGLPKSVNASWVRFIPLFTLETKGKIQQRLLDEVLPTAIAAIESRERVGRPLFDSIAIQQKKIGVADEGADQSVWGVATWTGVDPRTDFFTVEVRGLTNAQQIIQEGQNYRYPQKTLVLNFFRPGDGTQPSEDVIRYGVPAVNRVAGLKEELRKAIANKEYELTIVGGLTPEMNLSQVLRDMAQQVSDLGAQQIRAYSSNGNLIFSNSTPDQEAKIQQTILQNMGIQVRVVNRTLPLSQAIRQTELAKDEEEQDYVLEQFGLKERLDHYWVYR
jgi:hypothetical protein